jgi:hypothetical protein
MNPEKAGDSTHRSIPPPKHPKPHTGDGSHQSQVLPDERRRFRSVGSQRPHAIPALAAAVLLLIALGHHPYGYYTFLRWAVCVAAVVVAWVAWESDSEWATWPFVAIAILFNPLVPIYLQRSTWRPIDVICAIVFGLAISLERRADRPPRLPASDV